MVLNSFLDILCSKNQENQIFRARSSSGWVLTHMRTFRMIFQPFLILSYGHKLYSSLFTVQKPEKWNIGDEEFFGMSSYTCENFQDGIPNIFEFCHMVRISILDFLLSKNQENEIFGTRSSSGWVLTHVRTFNFSFSTTFNLIIWS